MTVRLSQCMASFEQSWSHAFLGVHQSLWPSCLWGLSYIGAECRLPTHTALHPRISRWLLQTLVSIPNNLYSAAKLLHQKHQLIVLNLACGPPHTFTPTHQSTRLSFGCDIGPQGHYPFLLLVNPEPGASLAQPLVSLIGWWQRTAYMEMCGHSSPTNFKFVDHKKENCRPLHICEVQFGVRPKCVRWQSRAARAPGCSGFSTVSARCSR